MSDAGTNGNGARLTFKQRAFVDEYLKCWNASEAARRAGYSPKTANRIGHENLTKPDILEEIQKKVKERSVSVDEALVMLGEIARGDMGDVLRIEHGITMVDLDGLKDKGLTHLIKSYNVTKQGIRVELYSRLDAIEKIMRAHGAYNDKLDIMSGGKRIKFVEIGVPDGGEDGA